MPAEGNIHHGNTYTLTANCTQTGALLLTSDIPLDQNSDAVTINGHHITPATGKSVFETAGSLTVRNAMLENGTDYPIKAYHNSSLAVENSVFTNFTRPLYVYDPAASIKNMLWENNSAGNWTFGNAVTSLRTSVVAIRDSTFRNNSGGTAAFCLSFKSPFGPPAVTLKGCATFDNNSPDTKSTIRSSEGAFTDDSTGNCPAYTYPYTSEPETPVPPQPTKVATQLPPGVQAPVSVGGGMAQIYGRRVNHAGLWHQRAVYRLSLADGEPGAG